MEWGWLHSLFFGLIAGFSEFLPVSAEAHRVLFKRLTGTGAEVGGFALICHISILLALLLSCRPQMEKIRREQRIASVPKRRRKRQPDPAVLLDVRVLKTAGVPMLLSFVPYLFLAGQGERLWLLAIILAVNGIILYIPRVRKSGNKDSRTMSALDSVLFGLGSALAALPGFSRLGCGVSTLQLSGADRQYALELTLLLSVPALVLLIGLDVYAVITAAAVLSFRLILHYILAALAAFAGAYLAITLMRFLAVNTGFYGFSYYCWGVALLTLFLYLMI